jgi:hypothetical protein
LLFADHLYQPQLTFSNNLALLFRGPLKLAACRLRRSEITQIGDFGRNPGLPLRKGASP